MKYIYTDNIVLTENKESTFITSDVSSGGADIVLDNPSEYSAGKLVLIGKFGNETSEIAEVDSVSSSTITLTTNLSFSHSQGAVVYVIDYDQIEISHAATTTGTKTVLSTIDIEANNVRTDYKDSTASGGYYFTRFSDGSYNSEYSDAIPFGGWTDDQVGHLIEYALKRNKTTFTNNVDHDFCIDEINNCLKYIHGKRKKWSKLQEFDYVLGQTEDSEWAFAVPSTMWGYSNKSVLDIHLEEYGSLEYKDEREWNEMLEDARYDTLSAAALDEAIAVVLTNSFGFGDSGTAQSRGDTITYTANDTTTGTLTCSALDNALADGSMVWGGDFDEGQPKYYTVKEGYVYVYPVPDSNYDNINLMLDYWKEAPSVDSDADTIDISRYDMVKAYLTAVIRWQKDNDGKVDLNDGDYALFEKKLDDCIRIEMNTTGQKFGWKPKVNKMNF